MEQQEYDDFPPEENEAPPDALPARPGLRRLVIAIYILIVICVISGLLLGMVWSGIFSNRFGFPLPEALNV
jgi:hypothetical protein